MLHLYRILEFNYPVGKAEIKTRYRELAKRYHPDVCKHPGATEQFKLISNAYQELMKIAPESPPPPPKPKPRKKQEKAKQTIFRVLNSEQKSKIHTVYYPADVIEKGTKFFFMYRGIEFSIVSVMDYVLPTSIKAFVASDNLTIQIVKEPQYY